MWKLRLRESKQLMELISSDQWSQALITEKTAEPKLTLNHFVCVNSYTHTHTHTHTHNGVYMYPFLPCLYSVITLIIFTES